MVRAHLLSPVRRIDDEGYCKRMITLADVDAIEPALVKLPDRTLVGGEPSGSFLALSGT